MSVTPTVNAADGVEKAYGAFSDEYTVFLIDRRKNAPYGYSIEDMAKDTEELLCSIGVGRYNLMGVSQGGMIAMYMAADFPESVEKLALCSSSAEITAFFKEVNLTWKHLAAENRKRELASFFANKVYSENTLKQYGDMLTGQGEKYTNEELARFVIMCDAFDTLNIKDRLCEIKCPAFVLGSEGDMVFGPDASFVLSELMSCDRYIYGKEYGHGVYDETPDCIERLYRFFEPEKQV